MARPTRGASETRNEWTASPTAARLVKIAAFIAPIVVAWVVVRIASPSFYRPPGWFGVLAWIVQAATLATLVSMAVERVARRALPLAALLNLSLVFPDEAPSRFATALRSGTTKQLERRIDSLRKHGMGDDASEAARTAIELVVLLGQHDPLTRGHTERVRAYADVIAGELGMSDKERNALTWGVMLHDIGKLVVPAEILNKKEKLTDEEWATLQRHPLVGQQMLKPMMGFLGNHGFAAGDHHERWDGGGYPRGIKGDQISLAGRITAVADTYDVITSKRSYKKAMSAEAARAELVRCSGSQFDPEIVRAFLNASLGRQASVGRLAWLTEIPGVATVANTASAAPTAVAGGMLVVASASPVVPGPELDLAFHAPSAAAVVAADTTDEIAEKERLVVEDGAEANSDATSTTAPAASAEATTTTLDLPTTTLPSSTTQPTDPEGGPTTTSAAETSTTTSTVLQAIVTTSTTTAAAADPFVSIPAAEQSEAPAELPAVTAPGADRRGGGQGNGSTTTEAPPMGPTAGDDVYTITAGQGTVKLKVLDNDTPGEAQLHVPTLSIVEEPQNLSNVSTQGNQLRVQNPSAIGTDTLTYEICDTNGLCDTADVTITVTE